MNFKIKNFRARDSFDPKAKSHRVLAKRISDEEICPDCNKRMAECECKKKVRQNDENPAFSEKEIESLKELIGLIPQLKKMLENPSEPEDETDVIFEESDDSDEDVDSDEDDLETDISEDDENVFGDSEFNPGKIENHRSASNTDPLDREEEISKIFKKRYDSYCYPKKEKE